jgi:hypothetical protein
MATEGRGRTPGNDLPRAADAFLSRRPSPEASVTRAATLLTLTPEPWTDYLVEEVAGNWTFQESERLPFNPPIT